jgi:hypothetical protein
VILHGLGLFRPDLDRLDRDSLAFTYTVETVRAVDAFREAESISTPNIGTPPGYVDVDTVRRLWMALERTGKAAEVRQRLKEVTAVRR